jgi:hypothetical protein
MRTAVPMDSLTGLGFDSPMMRVVLSGKPAQMTQRMLDLKLSVMNSVGAGGYLLAR